METRTIDMDFCQIFPEGIFRLFRSTLSMKYFYASLLKQAAN